MAYNEFAYFYDEFNGEADYDALYEQIRQELNAHDIRDGILADLGCGTGELTLMLTQAGYDMIGIDQSEEMLCVVRDKAEQLGLSGKLLLLLRCRSHWCGAVARPCGRSQWSPHRRTQHRRFQKYHGSD